MRGLLLALLLGGKVHALKVLVTGAGGRTGRLVYQQLAENPKVEAVALARSTKAQKSLKKLVKTPNIVAVDIADSTKLEAAMQGCDAVVLCTSAVPKIKLFSIVKVLWAKLRKKEGVRPEFSFPENGTPEEIDWLGAKKQIDAAVKSGTVKHFVFLSSMGGTQPENFLNTIGRRDDGSGGDILLWKRKAERYLIDSVLDYTIIHPGGLIDEDPDPTKQRELLIDVDDKLLELKSRRIPRNDVARVCCASLFDPRAKNKSFDIASKKEDAVPTIDIGILFDNLGERTADYSNDSSSDPPSIF